MMPRGMPYDEYYTTKTTHHACICQNKPSGMIIGWCWYQHQIDFHQQQYTDPTTSGMTMKITFIIRNKQLPMNLTVLKNRDLRVQWKMKYLS